MQSKLGQVLLLSLVLHISLVACFQFQKPNSRQPVLKPNKALVHTVYLKRETPKIAAAPKPRQKSVASAKKAPATVAKAPQKKENAPLPKKEVPKPAPVMSAAYADEIAMQLRLLLTLPEYGAVKVGLVLSPTGAVTKVEILDSQSMANEAYVREILPKLTLPPPPGGETPLKLTLSNA